MTPYQRAADIVSRWKALPKQSGAAGPDDHEQGRGEVMLIEMIALAITQAIADHRKDLARHGAIEQHVGKGPGRG